MISELVKSQAVWFRGVPHYAINICLHCGGADDPESRWAEDEDGDRICGRCKEQESEAA